MIPPDAKMSISGTARATSTHFLVAKGLRIVPVAPPGAIYFSTPTPLNDSPSGYGSTSAGIVFVRVTARAPPSRAA